MRTSLARVWQATTPLPKWPRLRTLELAASKYRTRTWNDRL
jgi:hypothetical protein